MRTKRFFLLAVLWGVGAAGCISIESSDPRFQTDFRSGEIWQTTVALHAIVSRGPLPARIEKIRLLTPRGYQLALVDNEGRKLRQKPDPFGHVYPELLEITELPAHTRIRIIDVTLTNDFENGYRMFLGAKFESGGFVGQRADLTGISHWVDVPNSNHLNFFVSNPAYLVQGELGPATGAAPSGNPPRLP